VEKDTLRAVHDDDLEQVLRGLGLYSDFIHGRLKCAFCKDLVTFDNLHSLFPDSGTIKLSCDKPQCVNSLLLRIEGRRVR
jgi:hypothetical protein